MSFWSPFLLGVVAGGVTVWGIDRRKQRTWISRLNNPPAPASGSNGSYQTPPETTPYSTDQDESEQPEVDADSEASGPDPPASATRTGESEQEAASSEQADATDDSPDVPTSQQL